jgi:succinate dehydrogenase / fumarate reductase, cytochrome b subunit
MNESLKFIIIEPCRVRGTKLIARLRMSFRARPLSPHLQIYRPQLTSVLSITHRASGLALAIGTLFLVWWLIMAAAGPDAFALAHAFWHSWIGRLLLLGWTWALFFHLCNGLRHLCWDAGWGFEIKSVYRSGWLAAGASATLTLVAWTAAYMVRG